MNFYFFGTRKLPILAKKCEKMTVNDKNSYVPENRISSNLLHIYELLN